VRKSGVPSPLKTIRAYCLYCVGGDPKAVAGCGGTDCPFHPYSMGQSRPGPKVIRIFCLECQGGHRSFVDNCQTTNCLCYPYRMGTNPNRKGIGGTPSHKPSKKVVSGLLNGKFRQLGLPLEGSPNQGKKKE